MRKIFGLLALSILLACCSKTQQQDSIPETFCNPVDISYRFCVDQPSRREAADPTIVRFRDTYFLFASKSGGYWHSTDLHDWVFIETNEIPVEEYAPTAVVIGDTLYFLASSNEKSTVYKSTDPLSGKWTIEVDSLDSPVWDPAFFLDDNQKLYLYWGCSNNKPLYGVEIDYKNNFFFVGKPKELLHSNPGTYGWEVPGDYNTLQQQSPWIEGAWVSKYNGKYYLQYSGPGTEFKSYSNGVYVSDSPLGPFVVQPHNPFSYKPEGFIAGAGHGSTIEDNFGNYWNISTGTISVKQMFERRLVLFPSFFDNDGLMYTVTRFGDYPFVIPKEKIKNVNELFTGWMLLSYRKPVWATSAVDSLPAVNINDENIRTYWAATSGKDGESIILDLEQAYDVYAVQINFAEHATELYGRKSGLKHRYTVQYSMDSTEWIMLSNQSDNQTDNTHVYIPLKQKVSCRYIRLSNLEVPDGSFAVSDLRVFGKGNGQTPNIVDQIDYFRSKDNRRSVKLTWKKSPTATGYNISFGIDPEKRYQNYLIYGDTTVSINSLSSNQKYYFTIESFNENGISTASQIISVE